jgi:enterobactin synthetase component D / holo-[acyl-carrier protein] synthase
VIEAILPGAVAAVETADDPPGAVLYPEEEATVARAVDKRRREFTAGRWCARRALVRLGHPEVPIPAGPDRQPQWPPGVVGSITHCAGYRAAALAHDRDLHTIGIDAEPHGPLPDGVLRAVALPDERDRLAGLSGTDPGVHWDRLLFSAKESVFKAWYPLARRWLGFEDADLVLDPASESFTARILIPGPVAGFDGRWLVQDGLVLTAVTRPA